MLVADIIAYLNVSDFSPLPQSDGVDHPDPGFGGLQSILFNQLKLDDFYLQMADEDRPGLKDLGEKLKEDHKTNKTALYRQIQKNFNTYNAEIRDIVLERKAMQQFFSEL
jgi:hypothetical protein